MSLKHSACLALIAATLTHPSFADERKIESVKGYERQVTENWAVLGISYPNRERNDVCVAFKEWKDGSKIELVKDLKSGELRIWHQTMGWNRVNDEKMKNYSLRMNFHNQQGNVVDGGMSDYVLLNKNTIAIFRIDERRFLKSLVNSNRLVFIPDGNVSNTQVYFDGKANDIVTALSNCVQLSGKAQVPTIVNRDAPIEPPSLDLPTKINTQRSL